MDWLGSLISGLFSIGQQAWSNAYNSREAEKDRDFQSEEARINREFQSEESALNRDFQSDEAELNRIFQSNEAALQRDWSAAEAEQARDWQEQMYAKYNSLSGKISQAEQAGVNPMFAITGNAVTPMSASSSMPSGASAGSVGTPSGSAASGSGVSGSRATGSLVNILGAILDGAKLKSEIELNESMAKKNISEANKTDLESSWVDRLSEAQLDNLVASKDELESRLGVNSETANKLKAEFGKLNQEAARIGKITSAEKRNLEAQAALAEFHSSTDGLFKSLDLGNDVLNLIAEIAIDLVENKTKKSIAGLN